MGSDMIMQLVSYVIFRDFMDPLRSECLKIQFNLYPFLNYNPLHNNQPVSEKSSRP